MGKVVKIKDVLIGEGMPKICVPMVGETIEQLIEEADYIKELNPDVVEWRVDFYENVENIDKVKETLINIRRVLDNKPIIFTLRSSKEGGQREVEKSYYFELNKEIASTKLVDVVDIELFNDEKDIKELIKLAHKNGVAVIISNHDFNKTPSKDEIILRLMKAAELGADIPKIAVMPTCTEDVLTLLDATRITKEKYVDVPIITMSMEGKGIISRLSGEIFGSALTFGVAKKASANGQISVDDLRKIIELIHNNLSQLQEKGIKM